jgi:ferric-dicitrate binding protein FerR (iron transport regulator)
MKCDEVQNLLPAEILGDLDGDPSLGRDIQDHLLCCPACAAERVELARTIGFIRQHKQIVAETCERLDNPQRHHDPRRLCPAQGVGQPTVLHAHPRIRRLYLYAAAASILIGVCVWLTMARMEPEGRSPATALLQTTEPLVEMLADGKRTPIPPGAVVATAMGERKTVLIDSIHEMVLNANTSLRVERVEKEGASGPLIRLASGEILAHVEHTGRPFIVSTQHGSAVITGTTFAIRADDRTMSLLVTEGTVRLESSKGEVQVTAGLTSAIAPDGAPSPPQVCDVGRALAWAYGNPAATSADGAELNAQADLADLWLTASSGPVQLEAIDYHEWTTRQRAWFSREFPWIFRLQDSLAQNGRQIEFPRLLAASGDMWQFALPDTPAGPVGHLRPKTWQALIDRYEAGDDGPSPVPPAGATAVTTSEMPPLATALATWAGHFRQAERTPQQCVPDLLMRSLRAGTYLVNTRTLLWLSLRHEPTNLEASVRSDLLGLLQEQVLLADGLTKQFIRLLADGQDMSCEERARRYQRIADDLDQLKVIEERGSRYEILE